MASDNHVHIFVKPFQIWPFKKVWYRSLCGREKSEYPHLDQADLSCKHCAARLEDRGVWKEYRRSQMKFSALKSFREAFGEEKFENRAFALENHVTSLDYFTEDEA